MGAVLLLGYPLYAELTVEKIEKMVEQIQGKRSSKVDMQFDKLPSPFAHVVQADSNATPMMVTMHESVVFKLGAIVNGKAHINGLWLKTGDQIQGYTVESVEDGKVVLKKLDRTRELYLPDPENSNLLQINEG
jgi:hypothetical protein